MDKMSTAVALLRRMDDKAGEEDAIFLCEDEEQQDRDLSAEDRIFLQEFPTIKRKLEVAIQKNLSLADDIDRAHKTFATTQVVTSSIAVVSSVMSFLGLALAPVTVGGSLVLSAAATGVGTVAGATSILTKVLEHRHNERVQAQVSSQVSTCDQEVGKPVDKLASYFLTLCNQGKNMKSIKKNMDALQVARAHPRLATAAKRLLTTGQVSARHTRQVQKAFAGTTLVLKRSTYLLGGATALLGLGTELHSLLNEWKDLKEGAKAKYAEVLRAHASEQERKLAQLTQHYERLRKKPSGGTPEGITSCEFHIIPEALAGEHHGNSMGKLRLSPNEASAHWMPSEVSSSPLHLRRGTTRLLSVSMNLTPPGGEAAPLLAQEPLSPVETEEPTSPQRHHDHSTSWNQLRKLTAAPTQSNGVDFGNPRPWPCPLNVFKNSDDLEGFSLTGEPAPEVQQ
ncbi:apolipoprotein L6 [Rhinolophus ferrumequinum]|uniref:apolipoprotein L6 n=1 Tax=Rhinolophus ferrumequinum TaxID=59479 RepID=UPI00140F568A|nr:apolipoprotein L6 [Rhinolophus ferrumequinum]